MFQLYLLVAGAAAGSLTAWLGTVLWYRKKGKTGIDTNGLTDLFSSISAQALRDNSNFLIERTREVLEDAMKNTDSLLGTKKAEIEGVISPLKETLAAYRKQLDEVEGQRNRDYGTLTTLVSALDATGKELKQETGNLARTLRNNQQRGRWGELQLKNIAELSGMSEYCDFETQRSVDAGNSQERPDMVVNLPSGRKIVVDAKTPMEAYLAYTSADGNDAKEQFRRDHAGSVKDHIRKLSGKEYHRLIGDSADFVVMFLPAESLLSLALDADPGLIEFGMGNGVLLASPIILIALLKAVALGWQERRLSENAEEIKKLGTELFERFSKLSGHLEDLGNSLSKSVRSYNETVGAIESRVLVSARRLKELGTSSNREIAEAEHVEELPKEITKGKWE